MKASSFRRLRSSSLCRRPGGCSPAHSRREPLGATISAAPIVHIIPPSNRSIRGNVNKLAVAWSYETGDEPSYTFSPLVVDNIAYLAAKQGSLVAVDATTGKELWVHTFESGGGGFGGRGGIAGQRGANYWESKDRSDRRIFVTSGGIAARHRRAHRQAGRLIRAITASSI